MQSARVWKPALGTSGEWRRRLILHHAPLAFGCAVILALFMAIPRFDANDYSPSDLFTGRFPKEFADDAQHETQPGPVDPSAGSSHSTQPPPEQGGQHQIPQEHQGGAAPSGQQDGRTRTSERTYLGLNVRRFTVASGYVATGLLGLTLLVGPANLLLRRRHPVSNFLARDVGTWAAGFSVIHVLYGLEVHTTITDPFPMFWRDGSPLTNSFGIANWIGLAATVIVVGLLATSSNLALRTLGARTWKNLQRFNYLLFALVIAHAFFYGALLRLESPFTTLLIISVIAVFVGQAFGVWLWRRRYARAGAPVSQPV